MSKNYWDSKDYKPGVKKKFKTPDDLWEAAKRYFKWVDDTPFEEEKAFAYKGEVTLVNVKKMRAMTIERMCSFIQIDYSTYTRYRKRPSFIAVCNAIDTIIRQQKFEGAASNIFNFNIIARDLNLKEMVDHSSDNGTMTPQEGKVVVTAKDVEDILKLI